MSGLSVILRHDCGGCGDLYLGKISPGDVAALVDTMIGAEVYVDGTREIKRFQISSEPNGHALVFLYGEEI